MAAFSGSFSLDALTEVAGYEPLDAWETLDVMSSLVDKSLVTAEIQDRGQRYHLLQSIHDYAASDWPNPANVRNRTAARLRFSPRLCRHRMKSGTARRRRIG